MKFHSFNLAAFSLTVSLFSVCSTVTPQTLDLASPNLSSPTFSLPVNACYMVPGGFIKDEEVCVAAGDYKLEKQNASGQFYVGTVYFKVRSNFLLCRGGVLMPSNAALLPRAYGYPNGKCLIGPTVADLQRQLDQIALQNSKEESPSKGDKTFDLAVRYTFFHGYSAGVVAAVVAQIFSGEPGMPVIYAEPKGGDFPMTIQKHFRLEN
jgi:hypothetical protein